MDVVYTKYGDVSSFFQSFRGSVRNSTGQFTILKEGLHCYRPKNPKFEGISVTITLLEKSDY